MEADDPIPALKRQLGADIARLIQGSSPMNVYFRLRVDQPRVSELRRQKLERFSLESLIRFAHRLDQHVELSVIDRHQKKLLERRR